MPMKKALCLVTVVVLSTVACGRARREAEVVEWMRNNAIPLATVEAEHGFDDLQPLKALIGGARIVALGEFSHGSRETFQMKHRMLEFLATEMGFSLFCFESPWPAGLAINEYVLHGTGDPVEVLRQGVFGVFYTQELLDTILWMRRYNEGVRPERRIQFCGFDIQLTRTTARQVVDYLQKVDPSYAAQREPGLRLLSGKEIEFIYYPVSEEPPDQEETALVEEIIPALLQRLSLRRAEYISRSSEEEWKLAQRLARILYQQAARFLRPEDSWALRDLYMAESVQSTLANQKPGTRMVLAAHNGHVTFAEHSYGIPMGLHLKKRFGSNMVVFGFAFNQGSFRAVDFREEAVEPGRLVPFTVGPAREGTLDAVLAKVGLPVFVLDLRQVPEPIAEWLREKRRTREVGGAVQEEDRPMDRPKISLPQHYDALIFIEKSTAAQKPAAN